MMTTKTYKILLGTGMAIGGAIVLSCGKKLFFELLDDASIKGYDDGLDYGSDSAFKIIKDEMLEKYGEEKGYELWMGLWHPGIDEGK